MKSSSACSHTSKRPWLDVRITSSPSSSSARSRCWRTAGPWRTSWNCRRQAASTPCSTSRISRPASGPVHQHRAFFLTQPTSSGCRLVYSSGARSTRERVQSTKCLSSGVVLQRKLRHGRIAIVSAKRFRERLLGDKQIFKKGGLSATRSHMTEMPGGTQLSGRQDPRGRREHQRGCPPTTGCRSCLLKRVSCYL